MIAVNDISAEDEQTLRDCAIVANSLLKFYVNQYDREYDDIGFDQDRTRQVYQLYRLKMIDKDEFTSQVIRIAQFSIEKLNEVGWLKAQATGTAAELTEEQYERWAPGNGLPQ